MRYTPTFLDEIRDRVTISSVIGRSVTWDKRKTQVAKGDFWACCPFHGEKSPSFHCEDRKGRYYCFGCGASGDHLRFMTEHNGLSFPEAVEQLASEAGVPLPDRDPQAEERERQKASLYDVMQMTQDWFSQSLQTADGAQARAYLRGRGLSSEIVQEFGLGFAPNSRNSLKEYLVSKGVTAEQMQDCGLVVHGDDIPVSYDRFRGRVMFPIHDSRGRVIAFGGRALSPDVSAKYLNSPETTLFKKGHILYNLHRAKKTIAGEGTAIVCEGYMDVVAMAAAGIRNCLAPLGTALTESQMQILWRYASEPILCFDGDKAGLNASFRSVDIALPNIGPEKSLRFVNLPEGKDPDDVLKSDGKAKMLELLSNNVPLSEMTVLRRLRGARADTPERKAALEKQLHSDVANIKDSIAAEHYRAHIKMRLLAFFGNTMASKSTPGTVKNILTKPAKLVEKIVLGLCVEHAELLPEYIEEIVQLQFEEAKYRDFVDHLYSLFLGENSRLPVHRVYELMPPHFYDVLGEVHGFEHSGNPDEDLSDQARARGHRLRELFPAIRFNPPIEIVSDTLALLLLKRRIDRTRHELNALLHDITYERLEAYRLSIESMIEDYDLAETYLDQEYQRLAVFSQQRAYT